MNRTEFQTTIGQEMDEQFQKLWNSYQFPFFDEDTFIEKAKFFFSNNIDNYKAHDAFFSGFTILTQQLFLQEGNLPKIEYIWNLALKIADEWEQENQGKRIHKGSPYHFLGIDYLIFGDLTRGFLYIHQALEEDKKTLNTNRPQTPGYHFATLHYDKSVYGKDLLEEIATYLDGKIKNYRSDKSRTLTIDNIKSKFLEKSENTDIVFSFVYIIFNLHKLEVRTRKEFIHSDFASLLETNLIFDLCLVVDSIIKTKDAKSKFVEHFDHLESNKLMTVKSSDAGYVNGQFNADFCKTLNELLTDNLHLSNKAKPSPIETDFLITYGFRNYAAHSIESQKLIYENFFEIIQRVLNALFFSVEKLL
jgi:hypothetical protein